MSELLTETSAPLAKQGKRWRAVLATAGQGSSGYYSEDVLREFGPVALPAGSKAFLDHDAKRSVRDMIGFYPNGAAFEEGVGLVGELEVFPHWETIVETLAPHTGLSIYMMGDKDSEGNVTKLVPHVTNGADLVSYPGLVGSGVKEQLESLVESARALDREPGVTSAQDKDKDGKLDKEILEALTGLKTSLDTFIAESKGKSLDEVQAKVDAEAKAQAVTEALESYDAKAKVIAEAELLPSQRKQLLEAAKRGEDITALVENAKNVVEESKSLTESYSGRSFGSAKDEDWMVSGVHV